MDSGVVYSASAICIRSAESAGGVNAAGAGAWVALRGAGAGAGAGVVATGAGVA